jgi:hypothetical protein
MSQFINPQRTIDNLITIHRNCGAMLKIAEEFRDSGDPKVRALAYEISIGVSKILEEGKAIIALIEQPEEVSEKNGFGALVD